ncbi:MAG: DegT/DnrJ/EryC1/StrS family aminotransferase [Microthrixaceae bacterium]
MNDRRNEPTTEVPITSVQLPEGTEAEVLAVLRSGQLAQGAVVAEFERRFAELCGVDHAVAVNNGTTALTAALKVHGLGPGDEVVTSPFTFVATLNAILDTGASVRFGDISDVDFNLDSDSAGHQITPATRALLPIHLYGQCADLPAFESLADSRGLCLIEDAAQAHGAMIGGRRAGSVGTGCFSFYATKNITCGEGGMVTTDSAELADSLRVLRNQGMRKRYEYEMAGNNYRLTDLAAAVGLPQLDHYDRQVQRRRSNAARLSDRLSKVPGLALPRELPGRTHVWHQYTVRISDGSALSRDEFVAQLQAAGIGAGVYYPHLVHDYECYRENPRVHDSPLPVARRVASEVVSLPVHPGLDESDLDRIASVVAGVLS